LFKKLSDKKKKTGRIGSSNCCSNEKVVQYPSTEESGTDIPTSAIDLTIWAKRRKRELQDRAVKLNFPSVMARSSIGSSLSRNHKNNASENDGMSRNTAPWNKNEEKAENKDQEFEDSTALGRKQKKAMEEYILKQMEKSNFESETVPVDANNKALSSEALYQELHSKIVSQGEDAAGNVVTFISPGTDIISNQDVGAGGTMLGGTGKDIHVLQFYI
jgi:spore germination protein GerM